VLRSTRRGIRTLDIQCLLLHPSRHRKNENTFWG
jgi:hypothetical protein